MRWQQLFPIVQRIIVTKNMTRAGRGAHLVESRNGDVFWLQLLAPSFTFELAMRRIVLSKTLFYVCLSFNSKSANFGGSLWQLSGPLWQQAWGTETRKLVPLEWDSHEKCPMGWDGTARNAFPMGQYITELSLSETLHEQEINNLLNENSNSEYECQNDN